MKNIKRCLSMSVVVVSVLAFATPTVTDVVAKQRYPWNGLVDITCKVSGIDETTKGFELFASAIVSDFGIANRLSHIWVVKDGEKLTDKVVSANGNYHLLWDAKADLGEVRYTNMVVRVIVDRARVQLWEGGPYWATTNIGAEKPEDYGYYFWWGDTVGYKRENDKWVASNGSNSDFSFSSGNAPTCAKSISTLKSEGWITSDGVLASSHDAATVHWGGDWRMPTKQEFDDLNSKCDWTWGSLNGVNGYVVRGRDSYASNSIFLPCAGYGYGTSFYNAGSHGRYWSSVPHSDDYGDAWYLGFLSGRHDTYYGSYRYGQSVRPLQGFTK
jgi:hypothetical protein